MPYDFKDYKQIGLTRTQYQIGQALEQFNVDDLEQIGELGNAYMRAKELELDFRLAVQAFAGEVGCLQFGSRPGTGIKDADRILEKHSKSRVKPLDMLAGKLVTGTLREMYQIAGQIPKHFELVMFKDRVIEPQRSGYRDLQCLVRFVDHIVELKVCHVQFDEADSIEHRVYEIVRTLDEENLNQSFVNTELLKLQKALYTRVWKAVLKHEKGVV